MGFPAKVGPYQFDGYDPIDEDVTGSVNDAHAAFADAGLEPVAPGDHLAEGWIVAAPTTYGTGWFLRSRLCHCR
jgi:hypothetical protein